MSPRQVTMSVTQAFVILGLKPPTNEEQVKAAFRKVVFKAHPDHGGTAEAFLAVTTARDLLLKQCEEPQTSWFYESYTPPAEPEPERTVEGDVVSELGKGIKVEVKDCPTCDTNGHLVSGGQHHTCNVCNGDGQVVVTQRPPRSARLRQQGSVDSVLYEYLRKSARRGGPFGGRGGPFGEY